MNIEAWLKDLGLAQYATVFVENGVDLALLPELTNEDLKDLGVTRLADRKTILRAIRAMGSKAPPEDPVALADQAGKARPRADAERRQLTVMFVDMVGSTALSSELDPEQLREVILVYQNAVAGAVTRYEGHVAKYMGDGVLAYFGWPQAHEDDAERAVRAGLAIISATYAITTPGGEPIASRLGIATGRVVVGDLVGEGGAQEEAVVGETPNLAARLQGVASPNQIVLSATTRGLLGELFELTELGPQSLKGFAEPVEAYAVVGERAVESRYAAHAAGGVLPTVGREQEIALLLDRWEQAKEGEGQVVLLSGEAGIGKSHIVQMLGDRIAPEDHTWIHYQCSPHHTNSALHPIIDQFERAAGFARDDSPDIRLDKLEALLARSSPGAEKDVPLFAALLSIPTGDRFAPLAMGPEQQKERTLGALVEQVKGQSESKRALIVFEDTHWIDPTSQELLDLIIEQAQAIKALILVTCRPVSTIPRSAYAHATSLTLNRLGRRLSQAMVGALTANKPLPEEVLSQILAKTDGVPLFIEELTKTVLEAGFLKEEPDRYVLVGPLPPLAIPTSLHDSLMARLDRLGPGKEVAQLAACIGREFSLHLLTAVSPLSEAKLHEALERLVAAELIFRHGPPIEATYNFKHALVQEAAHESLLRSKRREHHRDIATALQAHFPETVAAQPELVAYHFTEAEMIAEATDFWLQAGRLAAERSAVAEAVGHLTTGLSVLAKLPASVDRDRRELALQLALCSPLMSERGWGSEDTQKTYARARELCQSLDEIVPLLPVLFGQWIDHCLYGRLREGWDVATEFLRLSEQQHDRVGIMQGHRILAFTALFLGDFPLVAPNVEKSLNLYDPQRDDTLALDWVYNPYVGGLVGRAYCQSAAGLLDQAAQTAERAIAYARELNQISTLVYALINANVPRILAGDPEAVVVNSREALAISEEHGFPYDIAWSRMLLGWSIGKIGRREEGLSVFLEGLQSLAYEGLTLYRPMFLALQAELYLEGGATQEARRALDEAKRIVERTNERMFEAEIYRVSGDLRLAENAEDLNAARACFERAIEISRAQCVKPFELRATISLARLLIGQDEHSTAHTTLEPLYATFTEGFDTPDLTSAKGLLDELA